MGISFLHFHSLSNKATQGHKMLLLTIPLIMSQDSVIISWPWHGYPFHNSHFTESSEEEHLKTGKALGLLFNRQ